MASKHIQVTNAPSISGGGGTITLEAFTDAFAIEIGVADTNAVPTDAATFALDYAVSDSNAGQTETISLEFPTGVWADTNTAPTDAQSFFMQVWQSGSAGANVTNPTNANGQNDGANAVLQTAPLGASTITMTSVLGANTPAGVSIASATLRLWFTATLPLLTSSNTIVLYSTGALFSDITISSGAASHTGGTFTYDLVAGGINTTAKLNSMGIRYNVTDAVAGVSPANLTVDAGAIELAAAFT